ncbi:MAG TPA: hypothetical protein VHF89_14850 [Solirubrobacteraceae bacterium]|nr:hypothetical protein [Solirubrobacteraceae bacterium]
MLVTAGLAPPAPAARPALETVLQDDAQLLHGDDERVRAAFAQVRDFGIDRVRLTAGWSVLTRAADAEERPLDFDAADPAAYEQVRWAGLDRAVRLAAEHGIAVMIDVGFWAPLWAAEDAEGPRARTRPDARAYAEFAVAVARRYDGTFVPPPPRADEVVAPSRDESFLDSIFRPGAMGRREGPDPPLGSSAPAPAAPLPRVDVFSLWNEPNHPAFLQPLWITRRGRPAKPGTPPVYRAMVHAAYPAMKAARPDAKVLVGATSSMGDHTGRGKGGIAPLHFIRELACVDRRLRPRKGGDCAAFAPVPGDGWTHHPYSLTTPPDRPSPPNARDNARLGDLGRLTRLLDRLVRAGRLAPALRDVWLTEYGYESRTYPGRPVFGLDEQAMFLTWAEYLAWRNPRVRTYAQFLLRDLPYLGPANPVRRPQGHWESGLLFADGRPKPMAGSFRAGLHADRRGRTTVLFGRARGVPADARAVVERRVRRGPWRVVAGDTIGGRKVLLRRVRTVRRARYRMTVRAGDRTLRSFTVAAR